MYVLHHHVIRYHQIRMGEIPDCLNSGAHKTVRNLRRLGLRYRQSCNLNVVIPHKLLQIIDTSDLNPSNDEPDKTGINIEHSLDQKAPLLKIRIIGNCLSQITRTDNYNIMLSVDSEDLSDLRI